MPSLGTPAGPTRVLLLPATTSSEAPEAQSKHRLHPATLRRDEGEGCARYVTHSTALDQRYHLRPSGILPANVPAEPDARRGSIAMFRVLASPHFV